MRELNTWNSHLAFIRDEMQIVHTSFDDLHLYAVIF